MTKKEIEVKAKITNPKEIKARLRKLGCVISKTITQKDTVFFPNGVTANNTMPGMNFLRIREEKKKAILTLKRKTNISLATIEKETEIKDPKIIEEIILLLDFYKFNTVIKHRQKCKYKNYEICLDKIDSLGDFIEVEKITDEKADIVQKELFDFLETLGITKDQQATRGYDILLYQKLNPEKIQTRQDN